MRLIDADVLVNELKHITDEIGEDDGDCVFTYYDPYVRRNMCVNMEEVIKLCPTIDPVKHGKMIASEETNSGGLIRMVCSECNRVIYSTYGLRLGGIQYCPYCGARMDGEE